MAETRRKAGREPHWDNVRFLSGTLVVLGHAVEPLLAEADGLRWLYLVTWAMRVPVFVLVAGYFSHAGPLDARELRRLTESVLLPYLLLGLVHTVQLHWLYGEVRFFTHEPAWGLWFLLSLFVWRMLLPYLAVLRHPTALSVGCALAVGHLDGFDGSFSSARTVAFLPFFLLGWKLRQGLGERLLHGAATRCTALAVLAVAAAGCWAYRDGFDFAWLAMRAPYAQTAEAPVRDWAVRAGVLGCGAAVALAFVRLVPKRRLPYLSALGAGGLYLYLLHPPVLRALTTAGWLDWVGTWPSQLALIALVVALSAVLASPPVRRVTRPLVQPRLAWLYVRADGLAGAPRPAPGAERPPAVRTPGPS